MSTNKIITQLSLFDTPQSIPSPKAEPIHIERPEFSEKIRRVEFNGQEYIVLVDVMAELAESKAANQYWVDTKKRLKRDGWDASDKILSISITDKTGKRKQKTDCTDIETCLRIVQSIPSPKAEPIRQWLASLGTREIDETVDPESAIHRTLDNATGRYAKQGKDNEWIAERLRGIEARHILMDAIKGAINPEDMPVNMYSQTTETLYRGIWERVTAILRQDLDMPPKGGNVRDHFGTYALIYTGLAEKVAGELISQAGELTPKIAMEIVWKVAVMIKQQADATSQFLGRDLVTDKPLLKSGK